MNKNNMIKKLAAACAVALAIGMSSSSQAAFIDFKPDPTSTNLPEFVWSGTNLSEGAGSVGNADGQLPVNVQTPGGLRIETELTIAPVAGLGSSQQLNLATGSTTFFDVTLRLTSGFTASAAAQNFFGVQVQPLSGGTFELLSTDPDAGGPLQPVLLLRGVVIPDVNGNGAVISGLQNGNSGGVFAGTVQYTAGVIFDRLVEVGGDPNSGSFSWSLLDIRPNLAVNGGGFLRGFDASATGLFAAVVPEPATISLVTLAGTSLLLRRRRQA